ncbi:MAG TPA: Crp/Fnr family transcriptional regulator [Ignavibacteria bacterium]|nr:Crp/Fnr family transcriptional regulator [Ignavibacteria bacterium]
MAYKRIDCIDCSARENSLLGLCVDDELTSLSANKQCSIFKKGQVLFYEGNIANGLYCLNKGRVKIYKTGKDGKEQIIGFGLSGDFLGYRALIAEQPHSTSVAALEDTIACLIPKDEFYKVIEKNPEVSKQLMKSLCLELGLAVEKIQSLSQKSVRERVAETLIQLYDTFNNLRNPEQIIDITLPREDIANIAGTSTESLIRSLSEMKNERLIELEGKKIKIIDFTKLERIANP